MQSRTNKKYLSPYLFCLMASCLFILPFVFTKGSMYGDDLHFHIMRMEGLSNVFTSPVNFNTFYSSGQAINLFYPYLLYYPYFLIYNCIGHFWIAWMIYLFFLTNLTLGIAYISAKKISQSHRAGLLFALCYSFSAYRSHNILLRFAVGEFISSATLSLVFCGLYLLITSKGKKWLTLAIGMSLLIYSHVMSAIITGAILSILCLVTFIYWKDKIAILIALLKAASLCILLTAAFWLPMMEQFLTIKIAGVTKLISASQSLPIKEVLTVNLTNDITSHHIGLMPIIFVLFLVTRYLHFSKLDKLIWWLGILFWVMTTDLFDWNKLSFIHGGFIQLPWRFNTYALLMLSYLTASQLATIKGRYGNLLAIATIGLHLFSTTLAVKKLEANPVRFPWAELSVRNPYINLTQSVFVPDYTNDAPDWHDNISPEDPRWKVIQHDVYLNGQFAPAQISYTPNQASFTLFNHSSDEVIAYLPLYFYKGQKVTVNGVAVPSQVSPWSSTQINLASGKHHITVTYQYTQLARIAQLTSVMTVLILGLYTYLKRYKT